MKAKLVKHALGYILFDEKGIPIGATPNVLSNGTFSKLSLKNCQAIERGYDLYELAKENYYKFWSVVDESEMLDHTFGYVEGFQKALDLMGDKKFSEQDMYKMFIYGRSIDTAKKHVKKLEDKPINEFFNDFIQSLQQNEWEVEIDMTPYHDNNFINDGKTHIIKPIFKPTLDSEGCLILKKLI